jgi:alpha,alpha-trehalase
MGRINTGARRRPAAGGVVLCLVLGLLLGGRALGQTPPSPAQRFGALYAAVETRSLFSDSKTFADATPKRPDADILAAFERPPAWSDDDLRAFVLRNFDLPPTAPAQIPPPTPDVAAHIRALWPILTRTTAAVPAGSSALTLPQPYVVPGGRFRELYYWDSYFTMLGLARSGRPDLVDGMIEDFGSLIDRYGHIPNGTRTYYLSRSQPPFFYLMVGLSTKRDAGTLRRRNGWLRAEHAFWMAGAAGLKPGEARERVARLSDGAILNRYWDDRADPRDESYREDAALAARAPGRPAAAVYRDLRAAAESGWDFSSRWLGDGRSLETIRTTRIAPVDLNSLLYGLETAIARNCGALGDRACATDFRRQAKARRAAIIRHLWNARRGWFADYDLDRKAVSDAPTAAMFAPLFTGVATAEEARREAVSGAVLVREGGLSTTLAATGQQWDAPNGWAPLQWIAVSGLRRYGEAALAARISDNWLKTVRREYAASGRMLEKYDVVGVRPGGGGEYPLQDGFGWTNGVTLELLAAP